MAATRGTVPERMGKATCNRILLGLQRFFAFDALSFVPLEDEAQLAADSTAFEFCDISDLFIDFAWE